MTVLRSIPAPAEALLGSSALAHVVTRNRDGTPQVSVVWCGVRETRQPKPPAIAPTLTSADSPR